MSSLRPFYLWSLCPILFLLGVLSFVKVIPPIVILATLVGYMWPLVFLTPGAREKFVGRRYKFSVIGLSFKYYLQWSKSLGELKARYVFPLLFILILSGIMMSPWPLLGLLGIIIFHFWCQFILLPKFDLDVGKIPEESVNEERDFLAQDHVESHHTDID
ncbi:MAG: hypothetical protein GY909_06205 [Oligoflexia bacterium]|nr:hypothetical protein [Oligoflexia bacterium]